MGGKWSFNFSGSEERGSLVTHYAGRRFRSLIEARYAVFFDLIGVGWKYEPKTFYSRTLYLAYKPDFLLPKLCYWIEIKGQPPSERELQKIDILREVATQKGDKVFVLVGQLPDHPEDFPQGLHFGRPHDEVQHALNVARGWRFDNHRRATRSSGRRSWEGRHRTPDMKRRRSSESTDSD